MGIRDAVGADLPAFVETYNAAGPGRMATGDLTPVSVEGRRAPDRRGGPGRTPRQIARGMRLGRPRARRDQAGMTKR